MPEHDPHSPWSRETHAAPPADGATVPQPSHAWLSSEAYAAGPAQPGSYAPPVAPPVAPVTPVEVHVAAPRGQGLAVLGVVLGSLALLGMLGLLVFVGFIGLLDDGSGGGGGYGAVRGTIAPASGKGLTGQALADELTKQLDARGNDPEGITCPDTAAVAQDVTTVCHGSEYGEDTTFVVFFEDARGAYTLLEM